MRRCAILVAMVLVPLVIVQLADAEVKLSLFCQRIGGKGFQQPLPFLDGNVIEFLVLEAGGITIDRHRLGIRFFLLLFLLPESRC